MKIRIFFLEFLAVGIDIDPMDLRHRAELVLPHLQASPVQDADLRHGNLFIPELAEVPVIDLKIMMPFENTAALVGMKILFQFVRHEKT
jgi:hypothetical protein